MLLESPFFIVLFLNWNNGPLVKFRRCGHAHHIFIEQNIENNLRHMKFCRLLRFYSRHFWLKKKDVLIRKKSMIIGFDSLGSDKWQLFAFSCCFPCFPLSLRDHTKNESKVSKEQVLSLDIIKEITRGCLRVIVKKTKWSLWLWRHHPYKSTREERTYQAKGGRWQETQFKEFHQREVSRSETGNLLSFPYFSFFF